MSGLAVGVSISLSVCQDSTNMNATMIVGTTVQTISAIALPCVWGGRSTSCGRRR